VHRGRKNMPLFLVDPTDAVHVFDPADLSMLFHLGVCDAMFSEIVLPVPFKESAAS